ncbi:MAG: hypothetical protein K5928_00875 [Prevotella sp.]|nr:hypothetical protein [Prevotella sp.]
MKNNCKQYVTPSTTIETDDMSTMLCSSPVFSGKGIGYGGVDDDGTMEPEARRHRDLWDDEE